MNRKKLLKWYLIIPAALILVMAVYILMCLIFPNRHTEPAANFEQRICPHSWSYDGVCTICGVKCSHEFVNNYCRFCGYVCLHDYDESGFCRICGAECPHRDWFNGVCMTCGKICTHPEWNNGRCAICGYSCGHESWTAGVCDLCGYICPHRSWDAGICTLCGTVCTHENHDPDTRICATCGMTVNHTYVDGVCSCGKQLSVSTTTIPSDLLTADCPEAGTVETILYTTHNYRYESETGKDSVTYQKQCYVYLPYGYSADQKYNVLFLVHGAGDNESSWLTQAHTIYYAGDYTIKRIVDNMIYQGYCEPLILVTFTTYATTSEYGYADYGEQPQMTPEFRNDILPAIISNYSTYAEDATIAGAEKARDHFGMAGYSNGSLVTLRTGMTDCLDILSWFGGFSGNADEQPILETLNASDASPVNFFLATAGVNDTQYDNVTQRYQKLMEGTGRLTDNGNAALAVIENAGHDWTTWCVSFYDALCIFFQ